MPHDDAPATTNDAETLGDALIELGSIADRTQFRLVTTSASFASSQEWVLAGYRTAAHWMADHLSICVATAREWIRVGRKLVELPPLAHAFGTGTLNYSKVRALSRLATPTNVNDLVDLAQMTPTEYLGHALAHWSKRHESDDERTDRHQRHRRLAYRVEPDGMVSGSFLLPPAEAAVVMAAVDAEMMRNHAVTELDAPAEDGDAATERPSLAQRRADALVRVARGTGRDVATEVVVHVRGDGCEMDDGTPVNDSVVAAMVPNALIRALIHDAAGKPINASARRRHPSTRQKRVVRERDRRCVDCGSADLLEYDHVPPFELTGRTVVEELELRCAPCPRHRHENDAA